MKPLPTHTHPNTRMRAPAGPQHGPHFHPHPTPPHPPQYLHASNILHGDLKPQNVLLRSARSDRRGFVCKLCDFGLSRLLSEQQTSLLTAHFGTVRWGCRASCQARGQLQLRLRRGGRARQRCAMPGRAARPALVPQSGVACMRSRCG